MEKNQLRDYKQIWNSLQRYVNMFLSGNSHTDIRCTLQKKYCLYFPMEIWSRTALAILVQTLYSQWTLRYPSILILFCKAQILFMIVIWYQEEMAVIT